VIVPAQDPAQGTAAVATRGEGRKALPTGRRRQRETWTALIFLAPALLTLFVLRLVPAGMAAADSLYRDTILSGRKWVGLDNYTSLFTDPSFQNTMKVTLWFCLLINPLQVAVALVLAVLFSRRMAGRGLWRALVIIPIAVPPAVSAVIWGIAYRPDGLANSFLAVLGIPPQPFLTSSSQALYAIMVLLSWVGVGYWMMFLIAGINDIPTELYEAASLDGAGPIARFWHVTLPLLRRPLAFVLVADTVANFLVFAPIALLTKGGPEGSTNLIMYDIYTRAYTLGDTGIAQAQVVILVVLVAVIVGVQFRLLRAKD